MCDWLSPRPRRVVPSRAYTVSLRVTVLQVNDPYNPFRINTYETASKQRTLIPLESTLTQKRGEGSPQRNRHFKIEMVVVAAGGVERRLAGGATVVALEVLGDGEFGAAGSAKDGRLVPFGSRPALDGMAGEGSMAILAGVVEPAALHPDCDNVGGAVVVEATALRIEVQSVDFWSLCGHGGCTHFVALLYRVRASWRRFG